MARYVELRRHTDNVGDACRSFCANYPEANGYRLSRGEPRAKRDSG